MSTAASATQSATPPRVTLARITATVGTEAIEIPVDQASRSPSPLVGRSTAAQKYPGSTAAAAAASTARIRSATTKHRRTSNQTAGRATQRVTPKKTHRTLCGQRLTSSGLQHKWPASRDCLPDHQRGPTGGGRQAIRRCAGQLAESKLTELYARSFQSWCSLVMVRMVPERARITSEWDVAPPARYLTPASSSPSVMPVAAKNASSEATRSSVVSTR